MLKNNRPAPPGRKKAKLSGTKLPRREPEKSPSLIGTRKESSLHRSLKFNYSGSEGETETVAGNYVCDGRTGEGELIEVQTGSFGPLREKVKNLTLSGKVRIIHPVFVRKFIELYDTGGNLLYRRKSPKKGSSWDLFTALVHAPELPLLKNLTIELALIDVAEKRIDDGNGSWRRKGVRIADRSVEAWNDSIILAKQKDYFRFIPFKKNESFTGRNLAEKAGITTVLARKTLYSLTKMGIVERIGKQRNAIVYERTR
jgi:hypothetical protein